MRKTSILIISVLCGLFLSGQHSELRVILCQASLFGIMEVWCIRCTGMCQELQDPKLQYETTCTGRFWPSARAPAPAAAPASARAVSLRSLRMPCLSGNRLGLTKTRNASCRTCSCRAGCGPALSASTADLIPNKNYICWPAQWTLPRVPKAPESRQHLHHCKFLDCSVELLAGSEYCYIIWDPRPL